jgi:integrase
MKTNFYLKNKAAKVETPIEFVIQFGFTEINQDGKKLYKKIKRSTGLSIEPKYWNDKTQRPREFTQESIDGDEKIKKLSEKLNDVADGIGEIEGYLKDIKKEFRDKKAVLTIDLLKEKIDVFFKGDKDKPVEYNFITFSEYIVQTKDKQPHQRILNQTLNIIKAFSEKTKYKIDFDTINIDFYTLFLVYLNDEGYAKNTRSKHISNLKYFMNEARKRKHHSSWDYKDFKAPKERVENIYLNDNEIETIYKLDLTLNPRLEKVRDLFLIGCYTGLRFSDYSQIQSANIAGNILRIKTQKTGKYVKIPLRPEAMEIIKKYNGTAPPPISNAKMNQYLKEIAFKAGINDQEIKYKSKGLATVKQTFRKDQLVCTHTARRSFATNCYKTGIPAKQIMLITGHITEKEFFKYIQIDETENAELLLNHPYFMPKMKIS